MWRGDAVWTCRAWVFGLSAAVVGVVLVLISLGVAIGSPFYNIFDDDGAYVYLAQRLVSTGGLVDPFNARRMTSYGGATLYQSMFLHLFGNSSLRGFEFTFAALLLVIVTVQTFKRRWFAVGTLVVGLGVLLGHGIGPVQNLSPTLSAAALSVGAYQLLSKVRTASEPDQPWLYAVIGLVLGGILALRFYYLISVAIATVIVMVLARGRRSWRPLLLCAAVGIVSVSGWAVALYRSSRSLLFPLFEGNYNPSYPVGPNPLASGVGSYAHQLWSVVNGYDVGWVALACIVVGLGGIGLGRGDRRAMLVLVGAGVGCLAQLVIFTITFSGFAAIEIDRFEGPSTLACGLFALSALWPLRGPSATTAPARHLAPGRGLTVRGVEWRALLPGAGTLVLLIGLATLTFGGTLGVVWRTSTNQVKSGRRRAAGHDRLPRPLQRLPGPVRPPRRGRPTAGPRCSPRSTIPACWASPGTNSPRSTWPGARRRRRTCPTSPGRPPRCATCGVSATTTSSPTPRPSRACTNSRRGRTTSTRLATTTGRGPRTSSTG